jgi:quinol monooxygenase YgiN
MTDNGAAPAEVELTIVTLTFDSGETNEAAADQLLSVLSKYVVVSRNHPGCRNIDLCASVTVPGRFLVIQKWESPAAQQAHFDSAEMVEMAQACNGLLTGPPTIDLLEGLSAHDLN